MLFYLFLENCMSRSNLRPRLLASCLILSLIFGLSACNKPDASKNAASKKTTPELRLTPEDVMTIKTDAMATGPIITGSIQPERRADLRAEVSAVVMQVHKENGEFVRKGDLLVRLDETTFRDQLASAEQSVRAALQSLEQAERQVERLRTLRASGMTSMQLLEDAEIRRNNAQSETVAAKARAVQAKQQLQRTEIRAPFDGVVSERKVSSGDTAQVGKEMLKVIDPTSLRYQGLIAAESVAVVKLGQTVSFRINGYEQQFLGKVKRIDLAANATTRQVEVLVEFVNENRPKLAGLYAEGRIEAASSQTLMLPSSPIVKEGDKNYVWKIQNGVINKVAVNLGERDVRRGDFAVISGLQAGDQVLIHPNSSLQAGSKVAAMNPSMTPLQPAQPVSAPASAAAASTSTSSVTNADTKGK
jgi:RND family efflux transporter MFP subunit